MDEQLQLFAVLDSYAHGGQSNASAYAAVGKKCGIDAQSWQAREPIGQAEQLHSPLKRRVRWYQQTLKALGLLEPVAGRRGFWRPTAAGRRTIAQRQQELEPSAPGIVQLGFSTELGMALWADCKDAFSRIDEPVHLVLTSPPYPLAHARDYGGPRRHEYVDWLCACLEPLVARLAPGASVFLNVSNDIFETGSPARSLYRERLVLALHERLGLHKMDEWVWHNPAKAPGLRPHTDKHQRYVAAGGAPRAAIHGDGANRLRPGAFSAVTEGAIPRNVLTVRHNCTSQTALRKWARENGIPLHSATMPLEIAEHVVRFATEPGMLVAEPFAGWGTTPLAAERNDCRWIATERMRAYLHAMQWRFSNLIQNGGP